MPISNGTFREWIKTAEKESSMPDILDAFDDDDEMNEVKSEVSALEGTGRPEIQKQPVKAASPSGATMSEKSKVAKKPVKIAKKPVKVARRGRPPKDATAKTAKRAEKPVKKEKTAKKAEKALKKTEKSTKKAEKPTRRKTTSTAPRVKDRDVKGDGLREIERKIIKIVEKHGPISIKNIAEKLFGKGVPSECTGGDSIRDVRNAVRKPVEYGLLNRSSVGQVEVTSAYRKNGLSVAEKAVASIRATRKAKTSKEPKPEKRSSKKSKKSSKSDD